MKEFSVKTHDHPSKPHGCFATTVSIRWHTSVEHPDGKEHTFLYLGLMPGDADGYPVWQGKVHIGESFAGCVYEDIVHVPTIAAGAAVLMDQLGAYLDSLGSMARDLALRALDGVVGIGGRL